jgi:hypothetical protein
MAGSTPPWTRTMPVVNAAGLEPTIAAMSARNDLVSGGEFAFRRITFF